jgi:hypothetical protein
MFVGQADNIHRALGQLTACRGSDRCRGLSYTAGARLLSGGGMRSTFAVAVVLIVAALATAVRSRVVTSNSTLGARHIAGRQMPGS